MNKLDDDDVLTALEPSSIKNDPTVKNLTAVLNKRNTALCEHLNDALFLYRLDSLSSETLDHLAKQWSVAVWRDTWPLSLKRSTLKATIQVKTHLGTVSAIKSVLSSFGSSALIKEWWEQSPEGTPHTFEITINQKNLEGTISSETTTDLIKTIDSTKPVRSQYTLTIVETREGYMKVSGAERTGAYCRVTRPEILNCSGTALMTSRSAVRPYTYSRVKYDTSIPQTATYSATATTAQAVRTVSSKTIRLGE